MLLAANLYDFNLENPHHKFYKVSKGTKGSKGRSRIMLSVTVSVCQSLKPL